MGAGASSMTVAGLSDTLSFAAFLGKSITSLSFPGVYSLRDFDAKKGSEARPEPATLFSSHTDASPELSGADPDGSADDGGDERSDVAVRVETATSFRVSVASEEIVLADVMERNLDGWTPLHACCHSVTTAEAGLTVLAEMRRRAAASNCRLDLELKTVRGPGAFNAGFTPLHMAAAYGVTPMVEGLIAAGASVNCTNSFDWTPLLEACHRGFEPVARALVAAGADIAHVPSRDSAAASRFARGPPQPPLAEAARAGHTHVVKMLLATSARGGGEGGGGVDKDLANELGWTALHEACYYNHVEVARLLLVHGADAAKKNAQGALPYNLTGSEAIREAIRELGGPGAARDMPVPTFLLGTDEHGRLVIAIQQPDPEPDDGGSAGSGGGSGGGSSGGPTRNGKGCGAGGAAAAVPLHKGEILGELPALGRRAREAASAAGEASDIDCAPAVAPGKGESGRHNHGTGSRHQHHHVSSENCDSAHRARHHPQSHHGVDSWGRGGDGSGIHSPGGSGGGGGGAAGAGVVDAGAAAEAAAAPEEFLCGLSKRVMRSPVRTPYGSVFEERLIRLWLRQQGPICPLTGQPLSGSELRQDDTLAARIAAWRDSAGSGVAVAVPAGVVGPGSLEGQAGASRRLSVGGSGRGGSSNGGDAAVVVGKENELGGAKDGPTDGGTATSAVMAAEPEAEDEGEWRWGEGGRDGGGGRNKGSGTVAAAVPVGRRAPALGSGAKVGTEDDSLYDF